MFLSFVKDFYLRTLRKYLSYFFPKFLYSRRNFQVIFWRMKHKRNRILELKKVRELLIIERIHRTPFFFLFFFLLSMKKKRRTGKIGRDYKKYHNAGNFGSFFIKTNILIKNFKFIKILSSRFFFSNPSAIKQNGISGRNVYCLQLYAELHIC